MLRLTPTQEEQKTGLRHGGRTSPHEDCQTKSRFPQHQPHHDLPEWKIHGTTERGETTGRRKNQGKRQKQKRQKQHRSCRQTKWTETRKKGRSERRRREPKQGKKANMGKTELKKAKSGSALLILSIT